MTRVVFKLSGGQCACRECNRVYGSLYAFERHVDRTMDNVRCKTEAELTTAGWAVRKAVWRTPGKGNPRWAEGQIFDDLPGGRH